MATRKQLKNEAVKALDIAAALNAVTKEKSISMELVLDSLKEALANAARKFLNKPINVEVNVDREKGTIEAYTCQKVVEEVEDPEADISLEEAREIDPELQVGDEIQGELDINDFGRSAIQTAKQIIVQRVREFERQRVYADYAERIGELINGTVQQIDKGNVLINLGRTEALLPYREQIRKERYRQGDTIRACITEVRDVLKGPQIIVSRTNPMFLERLFEVEVPEIFEKIVRIVKIVRAPGFRAKVAVTTSDARVDPVGACVGMRGNRVQAVVRELSNERMDIISWTDEINLLARRVFAPAEVTRVLPVGEDKVVVIVREEDLAQAIGREGQNIRLASKLLDKEIDVYGDEEFASFTDEEREQALEEPEPEAEELEGVVGVAETDDDGSGHEGDDPGDAGHDDEAGNGSAEEPALQEDEAILPTGAEENESGTDSEKDDDSFPVKTLVEEAAERGPEGELTAGSNADTTAESGS